MAQQYDIGDRINLRVHIQEPVTGSDVDPSTVRFKVKAPDGTTTTYTDSVTRDSPGRYSQWIDIDQAGTWRYRVETTGTYVGAEEGELTVRTSAFA